MRIILSLKREISKKEQEMWTESRMGGRDKVERGRVESKEGIHESLSGREQKKKSLLLFRF